MEYGRRDCSVAALYMYGARMRRRASRLVPLPYRTRPYAYTYSRAREDDLLHPELALTDTPQGSGYLPPRPRRSPPFGGSG